ncbi:MAG: FtsQ-type POTRA domain-containing protein, partial [Candidatus Limnocylindria bacterium]
MKLKPQLRPRPQRAPRSTRGAGAARRNVAKSRGRGARRPGVSWRRRIGARIPSIRRVLAGLGAAAIAAGLVALLSGPWLRVTEVTWAGEHFTAQRDLARLLEQERGTSVLAVDTRSLRERIEWLPAVANATVSASLPG